MTRIICACTERLSCWIVAFWLKFKFGLFVDGYGRVLAVPRRGWNEMGCPEGRGFCAFVDPAPPHLPRGRGARGNALRRRQPAAGSSWPDPGAVLRLLVSSSQRRLPFGAQALCSPGPAEEHLPQERARQPASASAQLVRAQTEFAQPGGPLVPARCAATLAAPCRGGGAGPPPRGWGCSPVARSRRRLCSRARAENPALERARGAPVGAPEALPANGLARRCWPPLATGNPLVALFLPFLVPRSYG